MSINPQNYQPNVPQPVPNWNSPLPQNGYYNNPSMPPMSSSNPNAYANMQTMATQPNWNFAQQQRPSLPGRVVGSPQDIAPNEVPMDGTAGIFPQQDGSCIYVKKWSTDGSIQTVRFVPAAEPVNTPPQTIAQAADLSVLMERFDRLEQMLMTKPTQSKTKKEVAPNE